MKILITGSSGFVGNHLTKLLSKKHQIVKYDLKNGQNVLDENCLNKKLIGVDVVIHLAAFISATESWDKPDEYINNNALGTLSVVRNSIKSHVKKIVLFSSAAVKAKPLTPYAVSKITAEHICSLYKNDINIVIVRPENIYGPGQKEAYGYVIHNFIKAIAKGENVKIYGDGKQTRDFIYIDDVVKTVNRIIDKNINSGTVISIGTGTGIRIIDLAKKVASIVKSDLKIEYNEERPEPRNSKANLTVAITSGLKPELFTPLDKGIKKLLNNQYNKQ